MSISSTEDRRPPVSDPSVTLAHEMDAAVWTAIGLLAATSLGSLFYLGSRIDALGGRMDTGLARVDDRIDVLAAQMDAGFARVDARFDRQDARFDAIESRLGAHLDRHAS